MPVNRYETASTPLFNKAVSTILHEGDDI
jgi:hypothetical protein